MSGHVNTWRRWIDVISPFSSQISNTSDAERRAMAEALSVAAAEGPFGMECEDECRCGRIGSRISQSEFRSGFDSAVRLMRAELERVSRRRT